MPIEDVSNYVIALQALSQLTPLEQVMATKQSLQSNTTISQSSLKDAIDELDILIAILEAE